MNGLRRSEDGASLIIVLVVISVFGLVLSGLLTESSASIKYTKTVSTHEAKVYAADAGVSLAIQQVRQNNELCPEVGLSSTVPISTTINGKNVSVTCTGAIGSALGARGYAIQVRESSLGVRGVFETQSGGTKILTGPVFVDGTFNLSGGGVQVQRGNVHQKDPSCNSASPPVSVDSTLGYRYLCTSAVPALPTNDPPPAGVPATAPAPTGTTCKTFYPGTYTDANKPVLAADNYFVSGVYYFNFTGSLVLDGKWVYGGIVGAGETRVLDTVRPVPPTCVQSVNPAGYTGTGVKIIMGSTARFDLSKAHMELFARQDDPAAPNPKPSGTNGISVVAAPGSWTGWTKSAVGTTIIDLSSNLNLSDLALHGLVWARDQRVNLGSVNGAVAQTTGGVVANYVYLQTSNGDGLQVSVEGGDPDPRYVKLEATVSEPGARNVKSTAIIVLENEIGTAPTIQSWRTRGISDNT